MSYSGKCPCGRNTSGEHKILCPVCWNKLPQEMQDGLRPSRGNLTHVSKHTYKLRQKAAVNYIKGRL